MEQQNILAHEPHRKSSKIAAFSTARKIAFWLVSLLCLISVGVCAIVNLAVNGQLTWAFYPILSVAFVYAVFISAILGKSGKLTFAAVSLLIFPYLLLLEMITPVTGWFTGLALPIAAVAVVAFWICYFVVVKLPLIPLFKAALVLVVLGVFTSPTIVFLSLNFANVEPGFAIWISPFAHLVVACLLALIGTIRQGKRRKLADFSELPQN